MLSFVRKYKIYLSVMFIFFLEYYFSGYLKGLYFFYFKYDTFSPINTDASIAYFNFVLKLYLGDYYFLYLSEVNEFFKPENYLISIQKVNEYMLRIIILPRTHTLLVEQRNLFCGSCYIEFYYFFNEDHFLFFKKVFDFLASGLSLDKHLIGYSNPYLVKYIFNFNHYYWVHFCEFINLYHSWIFENNYRFFFYEGDNLRHLYYYMKVSIVTWRIIFIIRNIRFRRFVIFLRSLF